MSKKRIEDLIGYDFHTPNDDSIMKFLADNYETDCYSNALWDESDSYLTPSNSGMYTSNTQWGSFIPMEDFKSIIGMVDSQPTYTQSELSYITELEDRVEYLESLCGDLNKIVSQKDSEITVRQQMLDFQSVEISNIRHALDKWVKLTHLVSQNTKVADLLGARIGDDVIDKIHDYLLSRVK